MANFIKTSCNTITNIDSIETLDRSYQYNKIYGDYIHEYNRLLIEVVKTYIVDNYKDIVLSPDDEKEIADKLYERFSPIVKKMVVEDFGYVPEQYIYTYSITLKSGRVIDVEKEQFDKLCEIIGNKLDDIEPTVEIND